LRGSLATPASARDSATKLARQHFEKGSQYYNQGLWAESIAEFREAYELVEDPAFLFNMAQAYRKKGDRQRAIDFYKDYLVRAPNAPNRNDVEVRIKDLQKRN
jgi:tetratricopeptide (TPR) repeat protein